MHIAATPALQAPLALSPPPRRLGIGTAWHRHEFAPAEGYELRLHGEAIVRVRPAADAWRVTNLKAHNAQTFDDPADADALAARIARLMAAG